jgi:hypothetical protein
MNINGIDLANFNSNGTIMPYLFKATDFPTEYKDSPIQVIPPFPGNEGGFGGIQTRISMQIPPIDVLSIAPFGFKFVNNFIQGGGSYIGDIDGSYSSSVLQMFQFPNQALSQFTLTDNYNFQQYINIDPSSGIYAVCDYSNDYSFNSFTTGFNISTLEGQGAMYLGQGIGLRINTVTDRVWLGKEENGAILGVVYKAEKMFVGDTLIEENNKNQSSKYIKVLTSSDQEFWIPLYQ